MLPAAGGDSLFRTAFILDRVTASGFVGLESNRTHKKLGDWAHRVVFVGIALRNNVLLERITSVVGRNPEWGASISNASYYYV